MRRLAIAIALLALPAFGETIAVTPHGIVVAHDGRVELFDAAGEKSLWSTEGVAMPATIVAGGERVAVLDPLANAAHIIDLVTRRNTAVRTAETPVAGVFVGRDLYVLARDARTIERFAADGTKSSAATAADPAFLRESKGSLYVYSRIEGVVQEFAAAPLALKRTAPMPPFASDFEVDGQNGYLVYTREAKIRVVQLGPMQPAGTMDIGAVPVDASFAAVGNLINAQTIAVADPSSKRVWIVEGTQSTADAVARGFIRGLLGLGMYSNKEAKFPTGVDRVIARPGLAVAYDSSSRTLYRVSRSKSETVAQNVGPKEFALGDDVIVLWEKGRLRIVSNRGMAVAPDPGR